MREDDETEITAKFHEALTGRYGPLKPAQAISRCLDFIRALREAHLPWADIDRLFNGVLRAQNREPLTDGSVSRLYHVALRRQRLVPRPAPARDTQPVRSGPARPGHGFSLNSASSAAAPPAADEEVAAATPGSATDVSTWSGDADSYLSRIEKRRADKKRMDEA